jgi:membrane protein required for colicin V production
MAATIITLYAFQPASKWIAPHVGSAVVASGLASIGVFFLSLMLLSLLTGLMLKFMKSGNEVGVLDNLFGLAFGALRGGLVVAIAYFVVSQFFIREKNLPDYVQEAVSQPYVAAAAKWVGKLTPAYLDDIAKKDLDSDDPDAAADEADASAAKVKEWMKKHKPSDAGKYMDSVGEELPNDTLPSMEDLQERIRQENGK